MNELKILLKAARVNAGIEAKDFAKQMKKSPAWVTTIENNTRNILARDFLKWCELCDVNPSQIFLPEKSPKSKLITKSLPSANPHSKRVKRSS